MGPTRDGPGWGWAARTTVAAASASRPTVAVLTELLAGRQVVHLLSPLLPVAVVLDQVLQLQVPGLHPARPEVFPQEPGGPENARIKPVHVPAGAVSVESAEIARFGSVVVRRILLHIFKLEQLDVLMYMLGNQNYGFSNHLVNKYISEGIGPDDSEQIKDTRNLNIGVGVSFTNDSFLSIDL